MWECFAKKPVTRDPYKEKYKHLKLICQLYYSIINGGYVNFAVCEYYDDSTFTQLSTTVFTAICQCDLKEIKTYKKVNHNVFMVTQHFMQHQTELMFLRFENKLIKEMLLIIVAGLKDTTFDF